MFSQILCNVLNKETEENARSKACFLLNVCLVGITYQSSHKVDIVVSNPKSNFTLAFLIYLFFKIIQSLQQMGEES